MRQCWTESWEMWKCEMEQFYVCFAPMCSYPAVDVPTLKFSVEDENENDKTVKFHWKSPFLRAEWAHQVSFILSRRLQSFSGIKPSALASIKMKKSNISPDQKRFCFRKETFKKFTFHTQSSSWLKVLFYHLHFHLIWFHPIFLFRTLSPLQRSLISRGAGRRETKDEFTRDGRKQFITFITFPTFSSDDKKAKRGAR